MQRRLLRSPVVRRHAREPIAARTQRREAEYPPPVSSYTLRRANPAKTRADAVVVGLVKSDRGVQVADGGGEVAAAYGRELAPLLSTLGATGAAGEVTKMPTGGRIRSPLLVLVGLGTDVTAAGVRRAAGAAARAVTNAASVVLALPADSPDLVRAVTEGYALGGYTFTAYKKASGNGGNGSPGDVVVLSEGARRSETVARVRGVAGRGRCRRDHPRLGEHPARRPRTACLRGRGRRGLAAGSRRAAAHPG